MSEKVWKCLSTDDAMCRFWREEYREYRPHLLEWHRYIKSCWCKHGFSYDEKHLQEWQSLTVSMYPKVPVSSMKQESPSNTSQIGQLLFKWDKKTPTSHGSVYVLFCWYPRDKTTRFLSRSDAGHGLVVRHVENWLQQQRRRKRPRLMPHRASQHSRQYSEIRFKGTSQNTNTQ